MHHETLDLMDAAHAHARAYVESLPERRVFPSDDALAGLAAFDEPLPDAPSDAHATLAMLDEVGGAGTVAQTGGRYFGFVDGGMLPIGLAARWLADAWDQNTAHFVMSPVAAVLEDVCERWLIDLLGLPSGTAAGFVTGTTMANFSGLAAGRNELLRRQGWDVAEDGLYGAPPIRIIVGADAHAAVSKTLSLLGVGRGHTEIVPVDDQGRMRLDAFPNLDGPALVVTQAGNVNSGGFDPIGVVCDRAHEHGGWVHVDGAFGLWALASPQMDEHTRGIERADSWAVDAHKTLNVPYDCGIAFCKDRDAHLAAFRATAAYFQWSEQRDPMNYTLDMSKRARGIELWAILKTLGRRGVAALVDQLCARARRCADGLAANGFTIVNDVVFNQILVACDDDATTTATVERLQAAGECWCGGSTWQGKPVIRVSVCSWATTEDDIDRTVAAFVAARG